jgi:hypothetical protein
MNPERWHFFRLKQIHLCLAAKLWYKAVVYFISLPFTTQLKFAQQSKSRKRIHSGASINKEALYVEQ